MGAASETRRLGPGSYLLDGEQVVSVSTITGTWPKPALARWAARTCGQYVEGHWDWLTQMEAAEVGPLVAGAPWRDLQKAAARGTAVHALAKRVTAGEEVDVPEEIVGYVEAGVRFLDEWQPTDELTEVSVFSRKHKYGGTFDILCTLPGKGRALLDYKTSLKGPYGDTALQLSGYGHAEFMLVNGVEVPMPKIDFYGVVCPRADGSYELYPYTVTERTFRLFLYLQQVLLHKDYIERGAKGFAILPPAPPIEVPA